MESPEYAAVEAAFDAWEAAGDREQDLQIEANRAAKITGLNHRRAAVLGSEATPDGARPAARRGAQTLGAQFVESDEFTRWFKAIAPNGNMPSTQVQNSPAVAVPHLLDMLYPKASLLTGASETSAGAFVTTEQSGIYETVGRRPISLLDVISRRTTSSDTVDFVRMTSRTNNAAPVAEATDVSGGSGVKPQSDFALVVGTAPVRTIAHWLAATRRALADAGQLRGIIDDELRAGLLEEVEDQIINGAGTGQDFEGLGAVSGTQDQAFATDLLTTLRLAHSGGR